jgi:3-isopropylmalate/(R)-2-methylmalate dehydratase small subunit
MNKVNNYIEGIVANIDQDNIDTDKIIPGDFIKGIASKKLGTKLFAYLRYDEKGNPKQNFILNHSKFSKANIILSKNNFGCGSSREHAVWALKDFGIEVIIALSFSDIFYQNCIRNFLLPITVSSDDYSKLKIYVQKAEKIKIDINNSRILSNNFICSFEIKKVDMEIVIKKETEITKAFKYKDRIKKFQESYRVQYPWIS